MAATNFPFTLGTGLANLKNSNGEMPRYNFKNDGTYFVASMVPAVAGPFVVQGYSSSVADGGKSTVDGSGNAIVVWALGTANIVVDMKVQNNGSSGTNNGLNVGQLNLIVGCVAANIRGNGIAVGNSFSTLIECEAYSCNLANTANLAGISINAETICINCIAHDNTGSNNDGFTSATGTGGGVTFTNCIADSNGRHGFSLLNAVGSVLWQSCDIYNNGADGIRFTNTTSNIPSVTIRNCNFLKNGGWGINTSLTTGRMWGIIDTCGFGTGSQVNGSGTVNNVDATVEVRTITYASGAVPWVAADNGDFRINLPAAINSGRGFFTQTAANYAGTTGYPDIGAAQHYDVQKGFTFGG